MIISFKIFEGLNNSFFRWFGDSKVIKDGKPMVVFHGTKEKFDSFDLKKIGWGSGNLGHYGYGFYFSDDIREAEVYGKNIMKCYVKIEKPFTGTDEEFLLLKRNGLPNIDDLVIKSIDYDSLYKEILRIDPKAAKLMNYIKEFGLSGAWDRFWEEEKDSMKDSYNELSNLTNDYTTLNKDVDGVPDYVFPFLKEFGVDMRKLIYNQGFPYDQSLHWVTELGMYSKDVTDVIKKLGFDGVIWGSEYVVFDPKNIKSVDNDGSWDIDDPNIYS